MPKRGVIAAVVVIAALMCWRACAVSFDVPQRTAPHPQPESRAQTSPATSEIEVQRSSPSIEFVVRVVSTNGGPVAGATVLAMPGGSRWVADADCKVLGLTDESGTLRYPEVRMQGGVLRAHHDSFGDGDVELVPEATITLREQIEVSFRCESDTGAPIAGVRVAMSFREVPPLTLVPAQARRGTNDSSLELGWSDGSGRVKLSAPRHGIYFYSAAHPGYLPSADGITTVLNTTETTEVVVRMSDLWVAGAQFEGAGELVTYRFTTPGASGSGRSTADGRSYVAALQDRFPASVMATATWSGAQDSRVAYLSAWHTHLGWVVEAVPYQRYADFAPWMIATGSAPVGTPARVALQWLGPDGREMHIEGCSLRNGSLHGVEIPAADLTRVDPKQRVFAGSFVSVGGGAVLVPPGDYALVIPDRTVASSLEERPRSIRLAAGEERTITLRCRWVLRPLSLSIETPEGVEWERAVVTIGHAGQRLHQQSYYRRTEANVLTPPFVPIGVPVELRVAAPKLVPFSDTVVFTADNAPRVLLQPR